MINYTSLVPVGLTVFVLRFGCLDTLELPSIDSLKSSNHNVCRLVINYWHWIWLNSTFLFKKTFAGRFQCDIMKTFPNYVMVK